MKQFNLKRISSRFDGTFGVLLDGGAEPFALTVERAWADNAVGKSCIPAGTYRCRRVVSPKFGVTFEVTNVPGRTHILFHKGNVDDDSHGCIVVGEKFAPWSDGSVSVQASAEGFGEFMFRLLDQEEFDLVVSEHF